MLAGATRVAAAMRTSGLIIVIVITIVTEVFEATVFPDVRIVASDASYRITVVIVTTIIVIRIPSNVSVVPVIIISTISIVTVLIVCHGRARPSCHKQ
jgi:hypothetical protein